MNDVDFFTSKGGSGATVSGYEVGMALCQSLRRVNVQRLPICTLVASVQKRQHRWLQLLQVVQHQETEAKRVECTVLRRADLARLCPRFHQQDQLRKTVIEKRVFVQQATLENWQLVLNREIDCHSGGIDLE
ncbi:MAG: hypothetical protein ACPIOQ_68070, partial [Promethearchaeia archaeon]